MDSCYVKDCVILNKNLDPFTIYNLIPGKTSPISTFFRNSVHRNHPSWRFSFVRLKVSVNTFIGVKKKLPYGQEAKEKQKKLKGIEKDLSIKEAAVKYGVLKKKMWKKKHLLQGK